MSDINTATAEEISEAHEAENPGDYSIYVPIEIPVLKARGESQPLHKFFKKADCGGMRLAREDIHPAIYNPRTIDLPAQVKLRNILRKYGMVEPLIWNHRTGNLVGGHQRLTIMDQEAGKDHGYSVLVSIVTLTESEEKALNIALNNDGAQGMFDWVKMDNMLQNTQDFDIDAAGFDSVSLQRCLQSFSSDYDPAKLAHLFPMVDDPAKKSADEIASMKASKEEHKEQSGNANRDGFYVMIVFGDVSEKEKFCAECGASPETKVMQGRAVAQVLGVDIGFEPELDPEEEEIVRKRKRSRKAPERPTRLNCKTKEARS